MHWRSLHWYGMPHHLSAHSIHSGHWEGLRCRHQYDLADSRLVDHLATNIRRDWSPLFRCVLVRVFLRPADDSIAAYTFYRLVKHRHNFGRVVAGAHSALTTTRFVRLAGLSFLVPRHRSASVCLLHDGRHRRRWSVFRLFLVLLAFTCKCEQDLTLH